jgi:O-antigen/teichoic acid export membrane protein
MSKVKNAIVNSTITAFFIQGSSLVLTIVIARLLTPEEIGIYAISSVVALAFAEFKTLGAGIYLVREKTLDENKVRASLGVSILMSWLLGIALVVSSFFIADFYDIPEAIYILLIFSVTFFLSPYLSIPFSLLTRELNFHVQRNIKILSAISNLVITVAFILGGFSFYSIALGYSGSILVQVILLNFVYRHSSMTYKPSFRGLKPILTLGAYTSFAAFLKKANTLLPDAVIGKLGSATHVAMFSRGFGFSQFIFMTLRNGVGAVSLSYLSTVRREGGDISDAYTNGSYLFNGLAFPVLAVASLLSLPAIRLLFGDQWDEAAPIASCFMMWAAFRAVNFQFNDLAVAVGRPKLQVLREVISFITSLAICVYFFDYGLYTMAIAFVVAAAFEMFLIFALIKFFAKINFFKIIRLNIKNLLIALSCVAPIFLFGLHFDYREVSPLIVFTVSALFFPLWWIFCIFLFKHPLFYFISSAYKKSRD